MFGNTISNTWGPGGIRRSLIWQSGGGQQKTDAHNFVFDDQIGSGSSLPYSRYINTNLDAGVGWYEWLPPFVNIREFSYDYPYRTQWTTDGDGNNVPMIISDEYTAELDIDAYFYPDIKLLTENFGDDNMPRYQQYYGTGSGDFKYYEYISGMITLDTGLEYGSRMPCPFRITGTMVYSDYYFDIYTYGETYNPIDPTTIYEYFENRLLSLNDPSHEVFLGASTRRGGGSLFSYPFPSFELLEGSHTRQVTRNGEADLSNINFHWTKTNRAIYTGLNGHYGLYITPEVYPTILEDYKHYGWNYSTPNDEILRHNLPGFSEIRLNLPYATGYDWRWWTSTDEGGYYKKHPCSNPYYYYDDVNLSASSYPIYGTNSASNNTNTNNGCLFGTGIGKETQRQMVESIQINAPLTEYIYGQFQPSFGLKNKLLVDVSPSVALFVVSRPTTADIRTGRFKYAGFKGTISFFEMPESH